MRNNTRKVINYSHHSTTRKKFKNSHNHTGGGLLPRLRGRKQRTAKSSLPNNQRSSGTQQVQFGLDQFKNIIVENYQKLNNDTKNKIDVAIVLKSDETYKIDFLASEALASQSTASPPASEAPALPPPPALQSTSSSAASSPAATPPALQSTSSAASSPASEAPATASSPALPPASQPATNKQLIAEAKTGPPPVSSGAFETKRTPPPASAPAAASETPASPASLPAATAASPPATNEQFIAHAKTGAPSVAFETKGTPPPPASAPASPVAEENAPVIENEPATEKVNVNEVNKIIEGASGVNLTKEQQDDLAEQLFV